MAIGRAGSGSGRAARRKGRRPFARRRTRRARLRRRAQDFVALLSFKATRFYVRRLLAMHTRRMTPRISRRASRR